MSRPRMSISTAENCFQLRFSSIDFRPKELAMKICQKMTEFGVQSALQRVCVPMVLIETTHRNTRHG